MKKYDIVLIERQCSLELSALGIFQLLMEGTAIPLDIQSTEVESCAIGFITEKSANLIDYNFKKLSCFIDRILNDMNNESSSNEYTYSENGIDFKIFLTR